MARNRKPAGQPAADMAATAGDVVLASLRRHGIEHFFANPGTDFPPIVEGFARAKLTGAKVPRPVLVPHENLAVAMAHGAYLMTGAPQAVMVHVNVGTANTINLLANAARDRVPLLLMAGRSPIMEAGAFGARSRPIHWAQEMFDQAGMVREFVKWDYELRNPDQAGLVVARAVEAAMAEPRGPVYLTLPREPLSAPVETRQDGRAAQHSLRRPSRPGADCAPRRLADRGRAPAADCLQRRPRARGGGDPGPDRRALCAAGRRPHAALSLPADRPSPAPRLRSASAAGRCRPHPRHRGRRAVDAEPQGAAAIDARRPHRRGPGVPALSHALVPEPSVDCRRCRRGAARAGGRSGAPRATGQGAARGAAGVGDGARRGAAGQGAGARRGRCAADLAGVPEPLRRRDGGAGRARLQRVSAAARGLRADRSPAPISP